MGLRERVSTRTGTASGLEWVAVGLAVVTGSIHVVLGLAFLPDPIAVAFVLAGLGVAGALVLFALEVRRRLLYALGIPFVGSQIVAWLVIAQPAGVGDVGPLEAVDKVVQIALIVVLAILLVRTP
ncbi:DUF7475 family protein [Natrarchaeobaculum aegyptiacum]|uniref:Uncharacterized protein n=1 Tax=Natrarchaeobaculum aegyptiacum TaxID=745377 RepID=A0A2Z2HQ87_9EURY|nr:hypothetical protein [Natrarchaeobaculum aegyptiacum]ARS89290.1 hypothetical protein B1756_05715 [Natrarchaeobaculum aegyptiacum]